MPPYAWQDKNLQPRGKLVYEFKTILDTLEMDYEFIFLPHRRLIAFIEAGQVDLWAALYNSKINNDIALVSSNPIFEMEMQVFWHPKQRTIGEIGDLFGESLILVSAYSYGGNYKLLAEKATDVHFVIDHAHGFDRLFNSPNSYLLGYKDIADNVKGQYNISGIKRKSLAKYKLHIKVRKKLSDSKKLIDRIDKQLERTTAALRKPS